MVAHGKQVAAAVLIVLLVLVGVLARRPKHEAKDLRAIHAGPAQLSTSTEPASGKKATEGDRGVGTQPSFPADAVSIPDADVPPVRRPPGTMEDLTAKGFPAMSNPRKAAYLQTAKQTIPEVVADLGNGMTIVYCRVGAYAAMGIPLGAWWDTMSRNIKIMRLIEEGRKDPQTVVPLLRKGIQDCLSAYDGAREAEALETEQVTRGEKPTPSSGENDVYYNTYFKYESPINEFMRINYVINASFYTLANLNELGPPSLLADWVEKKKPYGYDCKGMSVYLIDCYFRQPALAGTAPALRHASLTEGYKGLGAKVKQSRWNAPWDIHDFLLAARHVNVSDIRTIEVLDIPRTVDKEMPQSRQDKIIRNFLDHAQHSRP